MSSVKFTSTVLLATLLIIADVCYGQVKSISGERVIGREKSQPVRETTVTCESDEVERTLIKKGYQGLWCDTRITDICHSKKARVAKEVCELFYAFRVSELEKTTGGNDDSSSTIVSSKKTELERELLEIEEQRLQLGNKKLDLRKREIELLRVQREIQNQ